MDYWCFAVALPLLLLRKCAHDFFAPLIVVVSRIHFFFVINTISALAAAALVYFLCYFKLA